jgi:hypothetical protein
MAKFKTGDYIHETAHPDNTGQILHTDQYTYTLKDEYGVWTEMVTVIDTHFELDEE